MPDVDITINERTYKVTCDPGQEDRLRALAAFADERVSVIAEDLGQIGETRLMLLTLLMVCDELFEHAEAGGQTASLQNTLLGEQTRKAAKVLDAVTDRLDALNAKLDTL